VAFPTDTLDTSRRGFSAELWAYLGSELTVVRRNPAFRIAIGGLAMAVMLCFVAAISLLRTTPFVEIAGDAPLSTDASQIPAEVVGNPRASNHKTPIQVANKGGEAGLLDEHPQRPVPSPVEFDHADHPPIASASNENADSDQLVLSAPADETSVVETPLASAFEPDQPATAALPDLRDTTASMRSFESVRSMDAEIAQLKGQVNELARTQLESQLAEIRHAEQLLSTHQSTRMVEALQREVDELKKERIGALESPVESPVDKLASRQTDAADEVPSQKSRPAQPAVQTTAFVTRVRFSETASTPGRFDVEADEATLPEFLAKLGPAAGWNFVYGPELTGTVTLRLSSVDLRQALSQVLKVRGWQIREEGEYAIINELAVSTSSNSRDTNFESEATNHVSPPITLQLQPESFEGSTYDQTTGILIQPGASARGTLVSRTRFANAPVANQTAQTSVLKISKSPASDSPVLAGQIMMPKTSDVLAKESPTASRPDQFQVEPKIEIEATIIETQASQSVTQGTLFQSIVVSGRGPCSKCGQVHTPADVPVGHAVEGWFELTDGAHCGVCSMSPELIVAQLQQLSPASVTTTPSVQVLNRQLAEIGLTEQLGFRRQIARETGSKVQANFLQGGVQLALRPTLEDNGTIRLDLRPSSIESERSEESKPSDHSSAESMSSLIVPPDSCVVIGGLSFEFDQAAESQSRSRRIGSILSGKSSEKDIREVVVILRVRKATDAAASAVIPSP